MQIVVAFYGNLAARMWSYTTTPNLTAYTVTATLGVISLLFDNITPSILQVLPQI